MNKLMGAASAATILFCLNQGAYAQTSGSSAGAPLQELEEIVITAQKVEATVQRTPISVQTISNEQVLGQGVGNAKDLQRIVPGLLVRDTNGGGSSYFIRGVGTYNASSLGDNGVAISLDQAYFSRAYGPDLALYDLERIEVLKGPQGTLVGRNATGGAINIISRKPIIGEFGGEAGVEVGNYNGVKLNGAVNVPLAATIAMRAAFQSYRRDGYMNDGYDDADTTAARVHVLFEPTENLSVLLTGEYLRNGQKGAGAVPYTNHQYVTSDPYEGGASPAVRAYSLSRAVAAGNKGLTRTNLAGAVYTPNPKSCLPGCVPDGLFSTVPGPFVVENNGFVDVKVQIARADIESNLGFATLSVIPAYLKTEADLLYYRSGSAALNLTSASQSTLEVRLASPQDQRLTWIVGAFYLKEDQDFTSFNAGTGGAQVLTYNKTPDVETVSKAVFLQSGFKILPNLTGTLGARRTEEERTSLNSTGGGLNLPPPPGPAAFFSAASTSSDSQSTTYRAALDWQVAENNLLYVSYSTGFHAGGINNGAAPVRAICTPRPTLTSATIIAAFTGCDTDNTYKPEYLKAYAIGSKNRFFSNRLQFNVEAYYWQYTDQQISTLGVVNPTTVTLRTDNAGDSTIKGVEAELTWLATRDDLFSLSYNYNKSNYGDYVSYFVIFPVTGNVTNLSGKPFLRAPAVTGTARYQHTFRLANGASIVPSIDAQFSSKVVFDYASSLSVGQTTDVYQSAYTKFNLGLAYRAPSDRWTASVFVRNVGNEVTLTNSTGQGSTATPWVNLAPPRTYGVNLQARF